jgi:hypothetical protein
MIEVRDEISDASRPRDLIYIAYIIEVGSIQGIGVSSCSSASIQFSTVKNGDIMLHKCLFLIQSLESSFEEH